MTRTGPELRHLRYFLAVADELHFGRAAERLSITQPSLSQQILKLERTVGAELFSRANRRVRLTPAGDAFRIGAIHTLEDADKAITAAREAELGIIGHLNIGFIETAAIRIVPEAVRRFRASHPEIGLTLLELGVEAQIDQLLSGQLDLGFIRTRLSTKELNAEPVLEEQLVAVVPSEHPLSKRSYLTTAEIAAEPLITVERRVLPELHDETTSLLREFDGGPGIAQLTTSVLSVLGLVAAGLGLALLPESARGLPFPDTVFLPIQEPPRAAIYAVRDQFSDLPHVDSFLTAVRAGGQ